MRSLIGVLCCCVVLGGCGRSGNGNPGAGAGAGGEPGEGGAGGEGVAGTGGAGVGGAGGAAGGAGGTPGAMDGGAGTDRGVGEPMPPRPSQEQAASALASVADQLRDVAAAGDDGWQRSHDLAVSLLDLGLDAAGPAERKLRGGTGTISNPSCLEVTGHTTAYRMCRADNFIIDGAITSETDGSGVTHLIYWALTLVQATAGASATMALDGEVWLSPTAMRGVLTVKLDSRVNGAPTQVTTRVSYNDVTISPCGISSGSIRVDYDIVISTVGGIGLGPTHSGGSALLEWTACNDLTVRNS